MNDSADLIFSTAGLIGIVLLVLIGMLITTTRRTKHSRPVHAKKRPCPICTECALERQGSRIPLWIVAWYRCPGCENDYYRYRWESRLKRPQLS